MEYDELSVYLLKRGDLIGNRYRIAAMIGRGGMGAVYAAEDLKLGNMMRAVKVTRTDHSLMHAYSAEARMLMKLNHPHLPQIHDFIRLEDIGCDALVMDYFDGQTVSAYFSQPFAHLSRPQIVRIGLQLCSALRYLHQQSQPIIHRDLKPSNVMLDSSGYVKLIDFGISRHYKEGSNQDTVQLGTLGFAAPEQEGDGQSDARTDIYGLGALLFYMASGGAIYSRRKETQLKADVMDQLQPDIPHAFKIILNRMLQTNPANRYSSMDEVEYVLKNLGLDPVYAAEEKAVYHSPLAFRTNRICVCMLSLSPGAGATFLTLTLASLLENDSFSLSAIEYYGLRAEWHAILSQRFHRKNTEEIAAFDERYSHFIQEDRKMNWFALCQQRGPSTENESQRFEQMLRQAGSAVNLVDLSGKWSDPGALQLLQQSQLVLAVGDPAVYKWHADELYKLEQLTEELAKHGGKLLYIANKDISFRGRREWLSLFPSIPVISMPLLSQEMLVNGYWSGRNITDDRRMRNKLKRVLSPVIALIHNELNKK